MYTIMAIIYNNKNGTTHSLNGEHSTKYTSHVSYTYPEKCIRNNVVSLCLQLSVFSFRSHAAYQQRRLASMSIVGWNLKQAIYNSYNVCMEKLWL